MNIDLRGRVTRHFGASEFPIGGKAREPNVILSRKVAKNLYVVVRDPSLPLRVTCSMTRCNSGADSIVWMKEGEATRDGSVLSYAPETTLVFGVSDEQPRAVS